jgi:hypothetical protein
LAFRIVREKIHEHADPPHLIGLLRARRDRPNCCRSHNSIDEIASSHRLPQGLDQSTA